MMPATVSPVRQPASRQGFTLIELLVVVGIIVVLISILLPVIGAVRRKANETVTTAELGRIAAGIQAYYNDFRAYPGPIPEDVIDARAVPSIGAIPLGPAGAITHITSSENLFLGLMGGLSIDSPLTAFTYGSAGTGPQSLNPLRLRQYNAYITVTQEELSPTHSGAYLAFNSAGTASDSDVPEFLDHIPGSVIPNDGTTITTPDFMTGPIIYMRARTGRTINAGVNWGIVAETSTDNTQQYNFTQAAPYGFTAADPTDYPLPSPNNPPLSTPPNMPKYTSQTVYFSNPNLVGQARSKDSFILISAGTDRKFGTKDDIIYAN